jgi:hypothetical protein
MRKIILCLVFLLSLFLSSSCSLSNTSKLGSLGEDVANLKLDQQILDTRLSLTEDRVTVLQKQLEDMDKASLPARETARTAVAVKPEQAGKTGAATAPKTAAAAAAAAAAATDEEDY